MSLDWMREHRLLLEKIIRFGNAYTSGYNKIRDFGTGEDFSPSQIQTFEYILDSEDRNEKMSEMARILGVSKSTFSKNVNLLMEKGMIEKFRRADNSKDIYVKPSQKGKEIYSQYVNFVLEACFNEVFSIANDISEEDTKRFAKILDVLADAFLWYFSGNPNESGSEKEVVLIKAK